MDFTIEHDTKEKQFFAVIQGKIAKLNYSSSSNGNILDYYKTFVPPELRGHQIGEKIVQFALEYAKEHHLKIIPSCPFVKRIIERHPEFEALIATR
jgi:predicted GNAT family acetyltransferase